MQSQQAADTNKTTAAVAENKTIEEPPLTEKPNPKIFNKALLSIVLTLIFLLVIVFVIFKTRKGKKGSDELAERISRELSEDTKKDMPK